MNETHVEAIREQDHPMVSLLLKHGADVNEAKPGFPDEDVDGEEEDEHEDKETPLSVAMETGNAAIIELLKSKGAKCE